jgi:hypothetical protein
MPGSVPLTTASVGSAYAHSGYGYISRAKAWFGRAQRPQRRLSARCADRQGGSPPSAPGRPRGGTAVVAASLLDPPHVARSVPMPAHEAAAAVVKVGDAVVAPQQMGSHHIGSQVWA